MDWASIERIKDPKERFIESCAKMFGESARARAAEFAEIASPLVLDHAIRSGRENNARRLSYVEAAARNWAITLNQPIRTPPTVAEKAAESPQDAPKAVEASIPSSEADKPTLGDPRPSKEQKAPASATDQSQAVEADPVEKIDPPAKAQSDPEAKAEADRRRRGEREEAEQKRKAAAEEARAKIEREEAERRARNERDSIDRAQAALADPNAKPWLRKWAENFLRSRGLPGPVNEASGQTPPVEAPEAAESPVSDSRLSVEKAPRVEAGPGHALETREGPPMADPTEARAAIEKTLEGFGAVPSTPNATPKANQGRTPQPKQVEALEPIGPSLPPDCGPSPEDEFAYLEMFGPGQSEQSEPMELTRA